ncbi:hypothetical protein CIB48_g675 [Xylaria polymorpha]|nr:hypothetical protein CIB48_g675 [Xylaria polymorpha]
MARRSTPAITQTPSSSSSLPSTQARIVVRGQHRLRGPIPLVATNPHQPLPAHMNREHEQDLHSHHLGHHSLNPINMDFESQMRQSGLPLQVEEDIRAAVLASLGEPSTNHPGLVRKRRSAAWRKAMRWLSVSLSIALVIGVITSTAILGYQIDVDAIFAFVWGPLLALWNGWRLFRLRQQFDREVISGWHIAFDIISLSTTIALTVVVILWTVNRAEDYIFEYDFQYDVFWRGVSTSIVFIVWDVLHFILLIITMVEKWTKPAYSYLSPNPLPPIVVQYMPTYTTCHEPQPGEDKNSYLAEIGDLQPQGIAPAYSAPKNDASSHTEEYMVPDQNESATDLMRHQTWLRHV